MYTVYLLSDADGAALYAGATSNVSRRLTSHQSKPWWPEVAKCELAFFATRSEMFLAETATITDNCPKYNVRYNEQAEEQTTAGERDSRVLALLAAGPASTTELRKITGHQAMGNTCWRLRSQGLIKPVMWTRTACHGGYMATWALAASDFPEVQHPKHDVAA